MFLAGGTPLLRCQFDVKEPPFLLFAALSDLLAPFKLPGHVETAQ